LIYIEKSPSALDRRVAFVIPDRQRTRERGVVGADSASLEAAKYVTEVLYISYQDMGESLRVSEAFRSVSIMDSTDPASFSVESGDYDFIVYLDLVDQETAQWYIKGTVSGGPLSLPVDLGVERRFRKRDWVKLVRAKAEELDSTEASQRGTSIQSVQ
jgi:hypothetical protein